METNFAPHDAGQDTGISGCREDLTRGGDPWFAPDQSLWSLKAAVH